MLEIAEVVKKYILEELLDDLEPEELTCDTELIRSGILDSLATLRLRGHLEEEYGIEIESHEIDPKNFGTINVIAGLVKSKVATA